MNYANFGHDNNNITLNTNSLSVKSPKENILFSHSNLSGIEEAKEKIADIQEESQNLLKLNPGILNDTEHKLNKSDSIEKEEIKEENEKSKSEMAEISSSGLILQNSMIKSDNELVINEKNSELLNSDSKIKIQPEQKSLEVDKNEGNSNLKDIIENFIPRLEHIL